MLLCCFLSTIAAGALIINMMIFYIYIYLYVYAKCLKRIYSCMISMYIKCSFTYCPFSQYVILSIPYAAPSFIQSICNFFQIFHISNFILPTMPDFPNLIYYYYIPFFLFITYILYYFVKKTQSLNSYASIGLHYIEFLSLFKFNNCIMFVL